MVTVVLAETAAVAIVKVAVKLFAAFRTPDCSPNCRSMPGYRSR